LQIAKLSHGSSGRKKSAKTEDSGACNDLAVDGLGFSPAVALAFPLCSPDIESGRLAVDGPLANRVRSGRKQP
jgi:hypothetical protein